VTEREDDDSAGRPDPGAQPEPAEETALDEEAAWAELVAAYNDDPEPGKGTWPAAEDVPEVEPGAEADVDDAEADDKDAGPSASAGAGTGASRSIVIHPVIRGPRDYEVADEEEGHFEPPEPPPLPEADVTTKFAWLAVLGGPALIFAFILLQQELPWWAATVGVGGFLGGFATLVTRMRPGDGDDDNLPGGGAVV
jgi:hypothetical protein